jgi:hypothetical protein
MQTAEIFKNQSEKSIANAADLIGDKRIHESLACTFVRISHTRILFEKSPVIYTPFTSRFVTAAVILLLR